jgi:multidrug efflux pump
MEQVFVKDEEIRFFTAYTGAGQPRFYLSLDPEMPNPGYAVFIVMTKDTEARERVRSRLMASSRFWGTTACGASHQRNPNRIPTLP